MGEELSVGAGDVNLEGLWVAFGVKFLFCEGGEGRKKWAGKGIVGRGFGTKVEVLGSGTNRAAAVSSSDLAELGGRGSDSGVCVDLRHVVREFGKLAAGVARAIG